MKKIAIIGASYLQEPLIEKAEQMGLETHAFAWKTGDPGERSADYFYPISIIEKEKILSVCQKIGIDGICTIASDLAVITVNYVAEKMHLVGNSMESTKASTNKYRMRKTFAEHGDPSVKSMLVDNIKDLKDVSLHFPIIVKPTDRSGSRGITKLSSSDYLADAVAMAKEQSFEKKCLVEEFAEGQEYSVECISYHGEHRFLAMTYKFTTGAPHFIETGHLEPAPVSDEMSERVRKVVFHALNSLGIKNGASHSELKIDDEGNIRIIEIGGRMGGDFIGSNLVYISTGIDFVEAVIETAMGQKPSLIVKKKPEAAGIRFIFNEDDIQSYEQICREHPEYLVSHEIHPLSGKVTDSASRHGYFLMKAEKTKDLMPYLTYGDERYDEG